VKDEAPRLALVEPGAVTEPTQVIRLLANSSVSLEGYLSLRDALERGRLDSRLRHLIGILVAEANGCTHALSAQVAAARRAAIDEQDIADAREGRAADRCTNAALRFVSALVHGHGSVTDAELATLRSAGLDDGAIVEIVSNVGLQLLTSYATLCAKLPPEDEPVVPHVYSE
jgi:AhpD family alkylhydroperoxidase